MPAPVTEAPTPQTSEAAAKAAWLAKRDGAAAQGGPVAQPAAPAAMSEEEEIAEEMAKARAAVEKVAAEAKAKARAEAAGLQTRWSSHR